MPISTSTTRRTATASVLALIVAACGGGGGDDAEETTTIAPDTTTTTTEVVEESTTTSSSSTTTTTEPEVDEPLRQPLTGEVVESEDDLVTRPALAVKIDNADASRGNHTGLARADVVFEEIVEDNNTRFAAIFHTQDVDPIGPIRSGRSQDVDILSSLNEPLFAWSGGNPGVTRLIRDSFLTDLNWQRNAGSYQRGPGRNPNNLYSDTDQLYALTPDDHPGAPELQWMYVAEDEEFSGTETPGFDVAMRRRDVSWDWNADDEVFVRIMDGEPHEDKTYGPITAKNVIVMVTEYKPSNIDARSPEAQTIGEGLVYIFSNGSFIEGKWSRKLAVGPIRFNDLDGDRILLTPGNTWVELAELDEDAGEGEAPVEMTIREADVTDSDVTDSDDAEPDDTEPDSP